MMSCYFFFREREGGSTQKNKEGQLLLLLQAECQEGVFLLTARGVSLHNGVCGDNSATSHASQPSLNAKP